MNKYMEIANELAKSNLETNEGGPFGACVVKDGVVVGKGSNQVLKANDPTAHAEIEAIRDACKNLNTHDLNECILYTSCYPCPMCFSAAIWANIKKVYYGNTKEDAASIGFRDDYIYKGIEYLADDDDTNDILDLECIDRDETIKAFEKFMEKQDKTMY